MNKVVLRHYYDDCCCEPSYSSNVKNADKSKNISDLSNEELRALIRRLHNEETIEDLIITLRRNSGEKNEGSNRKIVNTKTPINQLYHAMDQLFHSIDDKTKTIAEMSDEELYSMINRLRDEVEAERIIRRLKVNADGYPENGEEDPIDTKTPVDQLYHYGIAGQKWGIRRFQNSDGVRTPAGKVREVSEDHAQARAARAVAPYGLSNDQLRKLNERLELEKRYSELTANEKKQNESVGKQILKKVGQDSITKIATETLVGIGKNIVSTPLIEATSKKSTSNTEGGTKT